MAIALLVIQKNGFFNCKEISMKEKEGEIKSLNSEFLNSWFYFFKSDFMILDPFIISNIFFQQGSNAFVITKNTFKRASKLKDFIKLKGFIYS